MSNKYAGTPPGAREAARIAWRERVLLTAAAKGATKCRFRGGAHWEYEAFHAHRAALSAPRPWRSERKPTPRRRYSRAHRRGCYWCRNAHSARTALPWWNETARDLWSPDCPKTFDEVRGEVAGIALAPHGRRA